MIHVGLYEEHNGGVAAVRDGRIVLYGELERWSRVKNQSGWHPALVATLLEALKMDDVAAFCVPRPTAVADFLVDRFGATRDTDGSLRLGKRIVQIYDQDDLHGYLHVLSMLVLPGLKPGLYAVLVADAEQPRVGWIDLRSDLTTPPTVRLLPATSERWFNGEIFATLFGKIFFGTSNLEHCGKLMGLAGWGRTRLDYVDALRCVAAEAFNPLVRTWQGYDAADAGDLHERLGKLVGVDPLQHTSTETQDLAASAQEFFRHELVASAVAGLARVRKDLALLRLPDPQALLYSGGCALSVVTNRALRKALGLSVIAAPYAHDSSQFVGAAVFAALRSGVGPFPIGCGWFDIPEHTVGRVTPADILAGGLAGAPTTPREVAVRLMRGELIACVTGGAEAGPRALGHRSLLANALDGRMRDRINQEVKRREWYRPLAPMLPATEFPRYFAEPHSPCARYMLDTFSVAPDFRQLLWTVSSPDGFVRPQAVEEWENPWLYSLLREVGASTGHPVILNTSLNAPGLPIALDASQVLEDCATLQLDAVLCDGVLCGARQRDDG